jgi:threonine dehydratase
LHPFDDEDVIAGQATVGLEILNQLPDAQAVVVPVGGGGLISGVAYAVKTLKPSCKIYGVQALGADSMQKSYCNKMRTCAQSVATFADGIAVKGPGSARTNTAPSTSTTS